MARTMAAAAVAADGTDAAAVANSVTNSHGKPWPSN